MTRPTWDETWMNLAREMGRRGTCDRGRSGAVIVDEDQQIITVGYVGAGKDLPHCDDVGHLIRKVTYEDGSVHEHCVRTAHAEQNAINQASKRGGAKGATLYCKMEPCLGCCVSIINARIAHVIAEYRYHGAELTRAWLGLAGVMLTVLNDEEAEYAEHGVQPAGGATDEGHCLGCGRNVEECTC